MHTNRKSCSCEGHIEVRRVALPHMHIHCAFTNLEPHTTTTWKPPFRKKLAVFVNSQTFTSATYTQEVRLQFVEPRMMFRLTFLVYSLGDAK
jgi:hypothetical protein